jgi:type II restriction enzyme
VGKIAMVVNGVVTERAEARSKYAKAKPFSSLNIKVRGWTLDVLKIVEAFPDKFTLADVYQYGDQLARSHPSNRNIHPKIRQQLQVLRDMGMIKFLGGGRYLKV